MNGVSESSGSTVSGKSSRSFDNPAPRTRSSRVILFDLGGVLIDNAGEEGLRAILPYDLNHEQIWERWLASTAVRQFECGRISPEKFAALFVEEWRLELGPSDFIEAFAAWPRGLFQGAEDLVRELRVHHRVGCLTNNNAVHWAKFPQLQELFDLKFASHLTGFIKPDRAAFEHVLLELKVAANEVYFFDDLAQNIAAARAAGINAVQVKEFPDIESALRAEGLYE
jgi:HAD superfamily hydrolase (TIGR01509 family)